MRRLTGFSGCLVAALLAVAGLISAPDASGAEISRAGLVVAHDDGRTAYVIVSFDEPTISAAELLDRSGLEVTEVSFGGLGFAVCAIDATGCDVSECRKRVCQGPQRDDAYWQYFLGKPDGSWQVAVLGISADTVADGDVRAFVWSAEPPAFPAPSIDELALNAGRLNDDGVALTRYRADGSVDVATGDGPGRDLAVEGVAVVGVAVLAGGAVLAMRRRAA